MTQHSTFVLRATIPLILLASLAMADDGPVPTEVDLCRALENIESGDRVEVVLSGTLSHGFLYDPAEPVCVLDVQPSVCVELADSLSDDHGLSRLLEDFNRANVTVRGELIGPEVIKLPEADEPVAIGLARRLKARFCPGGSHRVKLLVQELLDVEEVGASEPWNGIVGRPEGRPRVPVVLAAEYPEYPVHARTLGVEGIVSIQVKVERGLVISSNTLFGSHFLADAALQNIMTWRFEKETNAEFVTTFAFALEDRFSGSDENPDVVLNLPLMVSVTAPRDSW